MASKSHSCCICVAIDSQGNSSPIHPSEFSYYAVFICAVAAAWKADHHVPVVHQPSTLAGLAGAVVETKYEFDDDEDDEEVAGPSTAEPDSKKMKVNEDTILSSCGLVWGQRVEGDKVKLTLGDDHKDIRSFLAATVNPHAVEAVSEVLRPQREMERAKAYASRKDIRAIHGEMATLPRCAQHGTWFPLDENHCGWCPSQQWVLAEDIEMMMDIYPEHIIDEYLEAQPSCVVVIP